MPSGEGIPRQKTKALRHRPWQPQNHPAVPLPVQPFRLRVRTQPRAPASPRPAPRAPPQRPAPSGPGGLISLAGGSGQNPTIPKLPRGFGHSLLRSGRLAGSRVLLPGPAQPGPPPLRLVSPHVGPGSGLCAARGTGGVSPACSWLAGDWRIYPEPHLVSPLLG